MKDFVHEEYIQEELEKLRDSNIHQFDDVELAQFFQTWINQFESKTITCEKLKHWFKIQTERKYNPSYAAYIKRLLAGEL